MLGSPERLGNSTDAAEIPVVRDNDVANAIGQGARPTERPEKAMHGGSASHFIGFIGIRVCLTQVSSKTVLTVRVCLDLISVMFQL